MAIFLLGSEPIFQIAGENGVLFLHNLAGSPKEFRILADAFLERGISVSAPLLKGHGTTAENLMECEWYDWFNDVKVALFELRKSCKKIMIVGQCMGATLGLHLAAHYQLEGFVGLSTGLKLYRSKGIMTRVTPYKLFTYNKDSSSRRKIANGITAPTTYKRIPYRAIGELGKMFKHVQDDLKDVYIPVLLLHSTSGIFDAQQSSEIVYEMISSKEKRMLKLNSSKTQIVRDNESDIAIGEIKRFAERILKQQFKTKTVSSNLD